MSQLVILFALLTIMILKEKDTKKLLHLLSGKVTAFAGPSGVGKSTLVNHFCPEAGMDTGEVSEKIKRGKHTTRHSEIFLSGSSDIFI